MVEFASVAAVAVACVYIWLRAYLVSGKLRSFYNAPMQLDLLR